MQSIEGDCLELMPNIPNKAVDMILCDLPYGGLNKQNKNAQWDCQIDLQRLWKEYSRLIKDNATVVLFGSGIFTANLMKSNQSMWRYNLVWDKVAKTGFLNANKMPLRQHEDIIVFYKEPPVYHPSVRQMKEIIQKEMHLIHSQKPVKLLELLIKTYTNKGAFMLDNTMGSGSTGVACLNINRRFIGIESEKKYFEVAVKRINNANSNVNHFYNLK